VVVVVAPHETLLSRFSSSLRLNYGVPLGNVDQNNPLSDAAGGLYHVEGAGDFLLSPQLIVGVHAGVGVASLGNKISQGCSADGVSCSVLDFDIGVHAEYLFLPVTAPITPWAGLGLTYEVLSESVNDSSGSNTASVGASGVDLDLSAGLDFNFPRFQIGPVATFRVGRYTSVAETVDGTDVGSSDIGATDWHEWLLIGVRGRFWLAQ
jgi:hypothetical protein